MEERKFHELLGEHIRESGYTNYEFSRITGIGRVNIQRYVSGDRTPNLKIFKTLRERLHLSRSQWEELTEQHIRALFGEEFYLCRRYFREILEQNPKDGPFYNGLQEKETGRECKQKPIFISLPAGIGWRGNQPTVQLIELARRADGRFHFYNLRVLKGLISTLAQMGDQYQAYYIYHDCPAEEENDSLLYPYYVLFSDHIVFLSGTIEEEVCVREKAVVRSFRKKFMEKQFRAEQLVKRIEKEEFLRESGEEIFCGIEYIPTEAGFFSGKALVLENGVRKWMEESVEEEKKRFCRTLQKGKTEAGIIRERAVNGSGKTALYLKQDKLVLRLFNTRGEEMYFTIREHGLCQVFAGYIQGLWECGDILTEEEMAGTFPGTY